MVQWPSWAHKRTSGIVLFLTTPLSAPLPSHISAKSIEQFLPENRDSIIQTALMCLSFIFPHPRFLILSQYKQKKLIYRRYAGLYIALMVDPDDNFLLYVANFSPTFSSIIQFWSSEILSPSIFLLNLLTSCFLAFVSWIWCSTFGRFVCWSMKCFWPGRWWKWVCQSLPDAWLNWREHQRTRWQGERRRKQRERRRVRRNPNRRSEEDLVDVRPIW